MTKAAIPIHHHVTDLVPCRRREMNLRCRERRIRYSRNRHTAIASKCNSLDAIGSRSRDRHNDPILRMLKNPSVGRIGIQGLLHRLAVVANNLSKHRRERLGLAEVAAARIQCGACVDAPHVVVLVPEHADHYAIQEVLQLKVRHGTISRQRLAIVALERRHRCRAVLERVPYNRAECTNVWYAHIAAPLHVPNDCKGILGRGIVIHTKRTTLGALQVRGQCSPRGVRRNQIVENVGRHLGNENL